MKRYLIALVALAMAGPLAGMALPAAAQSSPPPLPVLTPEQSTQLDRELANYRRDVDDRVSRGELRGEDAQRLIEWRRWQLARQIAGLAPPAPQPPRVIVEREYVAPPPAVVYGDPWYRPYYYGPRPYYYGPRVSICAGSWGHHSFGSLCF